MTLSAPIQPDEETGLYDHHSEKVRGVDAEVAARVMRTHLGELADRHKELLRSLVAVARAEVGVTK